MSKIHARGRHLNQTPTDNPVGRPRCFPLDKARGSLWLRPVSSRLLVNWVGFAVAPWLLQQAGQPGGSAGDHCWRPPLAAFAGGPQGLDPAWGSDEQKQSTGRLFPVLGSWKRLRPIRNCDLSLGTSSTIYTLRVVSLSLAQLPPFQSESIKACDAHPPLVELLLLGRLC